MAGLRLVRVRGRRRELAALGRSRASVRAVHDSRTDTEPTDGDERRGTVAVSCAVALHSNHSAGRIAEVTAHRQWRSRKVPGRAGPRFPNSPSEGLGASRSPISTSRTLRTRGVREDTLNLGA